MSGETGPKINSNTIPVPSLYLNPTNINRNGTYKKEVPFNPNANVDFQFNYLPNKSNIALSNSKQPYLINAPSYELSGTAVALGTLDDINILIVIGYNCSVVINDQVFVNNTTLATITETTIGDIIYDINRDTTTIYFNDDIGSYGDNCEITVKRAFPMDRQAPTFNITSLAHEMLINPNEDFSISFFVKPDFPKTFFGQSAWQGKGFYKRLRRSYLLKFFNDSNFSNIAFGFFAPKYNTDYDHDYKFKYDEICFTFFIRDGNTPQSYYGVTDLIFKPWIWSFITLTYSNLNNTVKFYVDGAQIDFTLNFREIEKISPENPILCRPNANKLNVYRRGFKDAFGNILTSQSELSGISFIDNIASIRTTQTNLGNTGSFWWGNSYTINNNYTEIGRLFIHKGHELLQNEIQRLFENFRGPYIN